MNRKSPLLLWAALAVVCAVPPLPAGSPTVGEFAYRIDNPTPIFNEFFGRSLASYGDSFLIGSSLDTLETGSRFGAVYVVSLTTEEIEDRIVSDPLRDEAFGISIDTRGEDLLVGALLQHSAHFFDASDGFSQTTISNPPQAVGNSSFGRTVRFAGDLLVIGAPQDDFDALFDPGSVYVMSNQTVLAQLKPDPAADFLRFGEIFDANDKFVAVGVPAHREGVTNNSGRVEVFDIRAGSPTFGQRVKLLEPRQNDVYIGLGSAFGTGVAFDGDRLLVTEGRGGDLWSFDLTPDSRAFGDLEYRVEDFVLPRESASFGFGIDARDGVAVIGSRLEVDDVTGAEGCADFVVVDPASEHFLFRKRVCAPEGLGNNARYGDSVAILDDNFFAVGAFQATLGDQPGAGSVFVYHGIQAPLSTQIVELAFSDNSSTTTLQIQAANRRGVDPPVPLSFSGSLTMRATLQGDEIVGATIVDGFSTFEAAEPGSIGLTITDGRADMRPSGGNPRSPGFLLDNGVFRQRAAGVDFQGVASFTLTRRGIDSFIPMGVINAFLDVTGNLTGGNIENLRLFLFCPLLGTTSGSRGTGNHEVTPGAAGIISAPYPGSGSEVQRGQDFDVEMIADLAVGAEGVITPTPTPAPFEGIVSF